MEVKLLDELAPVSFASSLASLRNFFLGNATHSPSAQSFRIFLDDACAMPKAWRSSWAAPKQWGEWGDVNWATKYQPARPPAAGHRPTLSGDATAR